MRGAYHAPDRARVNPLTPRETREGLILFRRFAQGLCGAPSQIALPSEPPLTVTVPVTFYHPGL